MQRVVSGVSVVLCAALVGCSSGAGAGGSEEGASSIALQLGTTGKSGTHYRLGPAKLAIARDASPDPVPLFEVEASGNADTLSVPIEPGWYRVTLEPDWQLKTVNEDGSLTPIVATLTTQAEQLTKVLPFQIAPVNFGFHLGASGIDIGVTVDEGIPAGYDGLITQLPDGRWSIQFASGGGACCFTSVQQAYESYPGNHFLVQ